MSTTLHDLLISDLEIEYEGQWVVGLTRRMIVDGLSDTTIGVLDKALSAPGVPQPLSTLPDYPNLACIYRSGKVLEDDPTKVEIICRYVPPQSGPWMDEPGQFRITGGSALQQKQTNFDINGNLIAVEYTFPADDPDFPSETVDQIATVSVLRPQTTIRFEGTIETAYPHIISSNWTGKINSVPWAGGAVATWMCVDVSFELARLPQLIGPNPSTVPSYKMSFTFQYDPETYVPVAVFEDNRPQYNGPPADIVNGLGIVAVDAYPAADFNVLFPV